MNERVSRLITTSREECLARLPGEDDCGVLREALSTAVELGKEGHVRAIRERMAALECQAQAAYRAEVFGDRLWSGKRHSATRWVVKHDL